MFNIVPQPNELIITGGKARFVLDEDTTISKLPFIDEFRRFVRKQFDVHIHRDSQATENTIRLELTDDADSDEGYRLVSRDGCIYIYARAENGLFYGLQTLKQLLLQGNGVVPDLYIDDKPRFRYRGFMLDSGRYFQPVEEIKRLIDLMALHKLNRFHWHLTEDQGWRIQIDKYPLLTEIGSRRSHTNFGLRPEGGFYTKDDVREIVDYCHRRFMEVVPEFDVPGHCVAAIACYPELSCFSRKLKVATHWGVKHDILCAGKESTYRFVFDVLDELFALFPDKWMHLGGDEAVKMRWKLCAHCQDVIRTKGLKDENELQQYFMNRVARYVYEHGFTPIMWNYDGVDSADMLDRRIVWQMCGANEENGLVGKELAAGRRMINASAFPYYLDFPYGWVDLQRAYEYEPGISENILGVEAPLWTEYVPDRKTADKRIFPRLAAIAEAAWSAPEDRSFARFEEGLPEYFDLLNVYHVHYATLKQAMPGKLRGKAQSLWFNRRVLHWQGLHNLIDDARVEAAHKNDCSRSR